MDLPGSLSVSRHANVGASARVNGDLRVGHTLFVEGGIESRGLMMTCKGMFRDEGTLRKVYPEAEEGWWALVGEGLPAKVYLGVDGKWVATGETSGVTMVYRDIFPPDNYCRLMTREEVEALVDKYFKY